MKLDAFIGGAVGFAQAVASGAAVQANPVETLVQGAGLPVWPVYALRQAASAAPDPRALALEARAAIEAALPLVRAAGLGLGALGSVAGALSPVAGLIGAAVAPQLTALGGPAGAALGGAALAAGPIVAAGGLAAGVAGGLAAGAPDPAALGQLGQQVADQLDALAKQNNADVIIDVPKMEV